MTNYDDSPYGHWVVAGKKYYNKLQAVTDAVPHGWWPHFWFHEDKFSLCNWTVEPVESLDNLYLRRARALRKKYNHISIYFSGGGDSSTALYSFLKQGLHVDLVLHNFVDLVDFGVEDKDASNIHIEAKHQAWPWFKKFQELDPTMKWQLNYTADIIRDGWSSGPVDPYFYNVFNVNLMNKIPGQGWDILKNVPSDNAAVVFGLDKPNLFFENNKFYLYFPESRITHFALMERKLLGLPYTDVPFYWDTECSDLIIKQAHTIMNWFKQNPRMLPLISNRHYRSDIYNQIVKRLIYPDYQEDWQTENPQGLYYMNTEKWFHEGTDHTQYKKNWNKSMQVLSDSINDLLIGTEFESFVQKEDGYSIIASGWSKLYYIGSL